jgi:GT2 family glycosyltransferase
LLKQISKTSRVLFVDNASKPEMLEQLKQYIMTDTTKRVKLAQTGENGGAAGGFSAAAEWAKRLQYDYVGCLYADAVADAHWVKALLDEIHKYPDCGIVTGAMLHADGQTIDSTGDFYTYWGLPAPRGRDQPASARPTKADYVFGATGGGFIARTDLYEKIGYYDRAMFMYYEDIDFSFRAQLAGYTVRYAPDAYAYHKRGSSSSTVPGLATYQTFKNLPILFVKNVPGELWLGMYPRFVLTYTLLLGNAIVKGRGFPAVRGFLASWLYVVHMFTERQRIQSTRSVTAEYISGLLLDKIPPDQSGLLKFRKLLEKKAP